jgi:NlpC/P60 family/Bacterial TSP3 repeat
MHDLGSHDAFGGDSHTGGPSAHDFVQMALSQAGDQYVWGAQDADHGHVLVDDPHSFDCQELVEWSAAKLGLDAKDASYLQYDELERTHHTMSVDEALKTPGALLFSTGANGKVHHVAISIGDGVHTIEAKGRAYGVGEFDAGHRFDKAGMLPGLDYAAPGQDDGNTADHFADTHVTLDNLLADLDPHSGDADHDGLTDALEHLLGTDAHSIDSDHDGLSDAYEIMTSHTDPTALDSDHDGLSDAREIALGMDPLNHDSNHDGHPDSHGVLMESGADHDHDGLDDALEHILGTSTSTVDSDHDGFSDALEFQAGYDGTHADSDPLHGDAGDHVGLEGLMADVVAEHQTTDAHAFGGGFEDTHEFAAPDDNSDFDDDLDPDP